MNVFITGINGFVGSALARAELAKGNNVIGLIRDFNFKTQKDITERCVIIRGDLLNKRLLKRIISDYEIDLVYHIAAQSIVRIAHRNPSDCFRSNIFGTINVMEAVRTTNKNIKVVMASSDKAYGTHETLPYTEDMKLQPDDAYSTSKACADLIAQSYYKAYNMNVNVIRCANIYGHGDMNVSRIIPNTIIRILQDKAPQIYSGVLKFRREFIFIDDVCNAYSIISQNGKAGEIYNIGDTEFFTVEQIVNLIKSLMNCEKETEITGKDFYEIPFQYLCADKLKALGWQKKTDIHTGLKQTIDWYETNIIS